MTNGCIHVRALIKKKITHKTKERFSGQSNEHSYKVWFQLTLWLRNRILKWKDFGRQRSTLWIRCVISSLLLKQ